VYCVPHRPSAAHAESFAGHIGHALAMPDALRRQQRALARRRLRGHRWEAAVGRLDHLLNALRTAQPAQRRG
jgi:hypothetical protein